MWKALAWPATSLAVAFRGFPRPGPPARSARSGRFDRGTEHGPPDADPPEPLRQPGERPRLDVGVPAEGLVARRLQVLEPGVGLFDQQELVHLDVAGQGHVSPPVVWVTLGPGPDGPTTGCGR